MEGVECGAASLAMILAYYGKWIPLEQVREECNVNRDGVDALNLVEAGRRFGLIGKGMRSEVGDLGTLTLPAIVFWNFNHFVVVEGANRNGVRINDPAGGPILIPWADFDLSFTGVSLVFEPGSDFRRSGRAPSLFSALAARARGARSALILCVVAGIALIVPGLTLPVVLRAFVDNLVSSGTGSNRASLAVLVLALIAAATVSAGLSWIQQLTLVRLATKLAASMSTRFFDHLLQLPIPFFQQRFAGALVTRTQVNDEVAMLLSSQLASATLQMITVAFYASLMFVYSVPLATITVTLGLLNFVVLRTVSRRRTDANRRLVLDAAKMTSTAMGGLQNIETIKAIGEEGGLFGRWAGQQAKVANSRGELGAPTVVIDALPQLLIGLNTIGVVGFGGWRVLHGALSLGTLAAFQVLASNFSAPIAQLVGLGANLQEMNGKLASVDDVLNYRVDEPHLMPPDGLVLDAETSGHVAGQIAMAAESANGTTATSTELTSPGTSLRRLIAPEAGRLSGLLELREVSFGFDPSSPPLIENLSLTVAPGARVAIIGASGSGKSTVAKLVCGLYQPWSGEVLFDNTPRPGISSRVLSASLALVDQDVVLFEGTVSDNIALWDPTITQRAIVTAAQDAMINRTIIGRPGGYDRLIEEGGRDWSGGQRQRIEIARALATYPALVVFDEATSALDAIVEAQIDARLRARGCSCLIIAHRLSTIRDADEILVMDEGKVTERGTHEELLAVGGTYAKLVSDQ
jgi:NHLM bacteriocin system ABC transporter peptidase/ATP-binding protein